MRGFSRAGLKGVILVVRPRRQSFAGGIAPLRKESLAARAYFVYAPYQFPLDHPDLEPIWQAAADNDLAIALHTFTVMPPYAPGRFRFLG